jgi:putative NADH-flavin reductase
MYPSMKITIFGATGRTGQPLVKQALSNGLEVTACIRNPAKMTLLHERLTLVPGELYDAVAVARAIEGSEAVLSVLGPDPHNTPDALETGMLNILTAMQAYDVRRIILLAGANVPDPNDRPQLLFKAMMALHKAIAGEERDDSQRAIELVRAARLDWTVVRAPMLTDSPATGQIRAGYVGTGVGMRLSRADAASFMLAQLHDRTFIRKSPLISN